MNGMIQIIYLTFMYCQFQPLRKRYKDCTLIGLKSEPSPAAVFG